MGVCYCLYISVAKQRRPARISDLHREMRTREVNLSLKVEAKPGSNNCYLVLYSGL